MRKYKSLRVLTILLFTVLKTYSYSHAQEDALGSWNILTAKYDHSKKIAFFGEGQLRSLRYYDNFHYHEFKAGITFKVDPKFTFSLAGGKYDTYGQGDNFVRPKNNAEYRVWPMFIFLQDIGKFKVEHRYRAEGRFSTNGYRNRFRARLGVSRPFGKVTENGQKFSVGFNNEVFFTNREPYFERNRFQLFVDYKLNPSSKFLLGYLYQLDYKITDETGTNFIVIGFTKSFKRDY
jgi:hypothetical protein